MRDRARESTGIADILDLADEFGRLKARVRFFIAGAQSLGAGRDPCDPLSQAASDLNDHVSAFDALITSLRQACRSPAEVLASTGTTETEEHSNV